MASSRNKTIKIDQTEEKNLLSDVISIDSKKSISELKNKTALGDTLKILNFLPRESFQLIFADPPYNLSKDFNSSSFKETKSRFYEHWLDQWISQIQPLLTPTGSFYICCDWKSSNSIYNIISRYFYVQNRITWEREKGRGSDSNWKNCSEDIYFCTKEKNYYFNAEAVKIKRPVFAPYKNEKGEAKDWQAEGNDKFRLTHSSNFWNDIVIPFWSMPENTSHPTQKPEKLLAKIILASTKKGDMVFDPFLGSGTTSVVAKKLNRIYTGIEIDPHYCAITQKRLEQATLDNKIQGYENGNFYHRQAGQKNNIDKNTK